MGEGLVRNLILLLQLNHNYVTLETIFYFAAAEKYRRVTKLWLHAYQRQDKIRVNGEIF